MFLLYRYLNIILETENAMFEQYIENLKRSRPWRVSDWQSLTGDPSQESRRRSRSRSRTDPELIYRRLTAEQKIQIVTHEIEENKKDLSHILTISEDALADNQVLKKVLCSTDIFFVVLKLSRQYILSN